MQASTKFKQAFLKNMLSALKLGGIYSKGLSFQERKKAIKLSADASMALARGSTTTWSQALISSLSKQSNSISLKEGCGAGRMAKPPSHQPWKMSRSTKILRRSLRARPRTVKGHGVAASVVARSLVKKRTKVLQGLIPGGESLDSCSLLGETLDYVICLRAQVDLMRRLAKALGASNLRSHRDYPHCQKEIHGVGR